MPRRNYKEGQWFLIPVPDKYLAGRRGECFGAGLVARGQRGQVVFAYIFGPWRTEPSLDELARLKPGDEVLKLLTTDMWLRDGRFPLLQVAADFSRKRWPMPEFGMYMGSDNPAYAVRTSDDSPLESVSRRLVTPAEARALPALGDMGYGDVFRKLADPDWSAPLISDLYREPSAISTERQNISSRIVDVVFFLAAPQADDAAGLARELESSGWAVGIRYPTADEEIDFIVVRGSREIDEIGGTTFGIDDDAMEAIAERFHAEYDGSGVFLGGEPEAPI